MKLKGMFDNTKEYVSGFLRSFISVKRNLVVSILFAVMILIFVITGALSKALISELPDQLEADRWSDTMRMAQVSIFTTQDQMITENDIKRFSYTLETKLMDAGVTEPEDEEDDKSEGPEIVETIGIDDMNSEEELVPQKEKTWIQKLMAISYSAQGTASISYENRTLDNASVIGVAGDFFLFHPMILVSGSYFGGDDLMKDRIVIDEDTAWQLFGSTDIIGQQVLVGETPHYIAGVVRKDTGRIQKAAGLSNCYVFMSLESLSRYGTSILSGRYDSRDIAEDGASAMDGGINCIEVVCPNPVNGLAAKLSGEAIGLDETSCTVIDNTDRFSPFALFNVLRAFGTRSMWGKAIFYPYWENIARGYEDMLAILLLFRAIALLTMAVIVAIVVVNLYRHKKWTVRGVVNYLSDKKYDLEVSHKQKKAEKNVLNAGDLLDGGEE
jgi:hypothetical protein